MKTYKFKIELIGTGNNPDEAWCDAVDGFAQDPGATPHESDIEIIEEDDN